MLMVQATDQIGSLLEILKIFATHQVNVRQIENRPLHQDSTTQARFFLEISGHIQDPAIQNAITDLRQARNQVKPLGSYPAPTWIEER
jgi:chorismate mutase/prephenate dehydratase